MAHDAVLQRVVGSHAALQRVVGTCKSRLELEVGFHVVCRSVVTIGVNAGWSSGWSRLKLHRDTGWEWLSGGYCDSV